MANPLSPSSMEWWIALQDGWFTSRAGHDRPLLLHAGVAQSLSGYGMPLGIMESADFRLSDEKVLLASGDRLVLYTDGLTDVASPDGAFFDLPRLVALLESSAGLPLNRMCESVFTSLLEYQAGAEQFDDMSLLVAQVDLEEQ